MNPSQARHLFPITKNHIFMNHAGMSPMSYRVQAALGGLLDELTSTAFHHSLIEESTQQLRGSLAGLVGAPTETIAITRSAAHSLSLLVQGFPWSPGDNLIRTSGSGIVDSHSWSSLPEKGIEIRELENSYEEITPETIFSLADERTRLISINHVHPWTGRQIDAQAIGREAQSRGIIVALDASQSVGAIAIDLAELPVDFLAADAWRFIMGPVGIGFAYCAADLCKKLRPNSSAVIGTSPEATFDALFQPPTADHPLEESPFSSLDTIAFGVATNLLLEVGLPVIEAEVLKLTTQLAEGLVERGYELIGEWPRQSAQASGIVSFRRPGSSLHELRREMKAAGIVAQAHADFVRLSPHFFNTEQEVFRVLEMLTPTQALVRH
ncbi:MAG: aminotransferase class V-fold PLP-dependent enzyme [Candidatus Dormibacteraceae bacterium]